MKLYGDKDNLNILQMLKWNKTKNYPNYIL